MSGNTRRAHRQVLKPRGARADALAPLFIKETKPWPNMWAH
jgi:hypothetical protein